MLLVVQIVMNYFEEETEEEERGSWSLPILVSVPIACTPYMHRCVERIRALKGEPHAKISTHKIVLIQALQTYATSVGEHIVVVWWGRLSKHQATPNVQHRQQDVSWCRCCRVTTCKHTGCAPTSQGTLANCMWHQPILRLGVVKLG